MEDAAYLRTQAEKCRALSRGITDNDLIARLLSIAGDYDEQARRLDRDAEPPLPRPE